MLTQARLRELLSYDPETGIFTWRRGNGKRTDIAGKTAGFDCNGYKYLCVDYQKYPAHRVAWFFVHGRWPNGEIDHINRVRNDNRMSNLREATHVQNTYNGPPRKRNTSGMVGVSWDPVNSKWRAHITVGGKMQDLGRFECLEDAAGARNLAATKHFGLFAPLTAQ